MTTKTNAKLVPDPPSDSAQPPPVSGTIRARRGQAYAELEGGQGREVFFRPHRYQLEELGPVHPVVHVA
jgi:hypothetical protein